MINTAIVDRSPAVNWDDVAGLDKAKQTLMEMVILPTKRRDLFTGLRKPARGLLLFGPPGNGKTMLAKAVASESEATFFNVSASSLTSKWIDSVLSARVANENDASRRLKSEFLVQFDGVTSKQNDFVKRIYIPLPDENVRKLLLRNQLKGRAYSLPSDDLERLAKITDGYSGSDLQALCEEAAMMPIRELGPQHILTIKASQVRPLRYEDFQKAMVVIRPSLRKSKWEELERWNEEFGLKTVEKSNPNRRDGAAPPGRRDHIALTETLMRHTPTTSTSGRSLHKPRQRIIDSRSSSSAPRTRYGMQSKARAMAHGTASPAAHSSARCPSAAIIASGSCRIARRASAHDGPGTASVTAKQCGPSLWATRTTLGPPKRLCSPPSASWYAPPRNIPR
ncbi:MIT (microtubule interacting and transport) domain [Musa troglodytarum]|uniref:MIT (Microtubule interacting and transport) domain n=1 Tax=Musa troglodytarum TaxID=320322 RepID=A0A9E7L760_9LILI|nr:MIT (microtubule interacting and transport) domain [Musa troglodytarum]